MNISILDIAGRRCHFYSQNEPQCLLVQPLGKHEQDTLEMETGVISASVSSPFALVAFEIADWWSELMPWSDPALSKDLAGESHATDTLQYIQNGLLPFLERRFGRIPVVLGGYSLAGLFSLWAAHETNSFIGVAAASPSIWIQGWQEYSQSHSLQACQAYLSLGRREEHTRNHAFAQVGERIRGEYALLQRQLGDGNCILEWNSGGHFSDCDRRLANAFIWNLHRLAEK